MVRPQLLHDATIGRCVISPDYENLGSRCATCTVGHGVVMRKHCAELRLREQCGLVSGAYPSCPSWTISSCFRAISTRRCSHLSVPGRPSNAMPPKMRTAHRGVVSSSRASLANARSLVTALPPPQARSTSLPGPMPASRRAVPAASTAPR